jgi:hypothetical protein
VQRRNLGLTRPTAIHPHPTTEFELDGPVLRLTHTTVYGRRFEATAPRDVDRLGLASTCAMGLHLDHEEAIALADEVLRRLGRVPATAP